MRTTKYYDHLLLESFEKSLNQALDNKVTTINELTETCNLPEDITDGMMTNIIHMYGNGKVDVVKDGYIYYA